LYLVRHQGIKRILAVVENRVQLACNTDGNNRLPGLIPRYNENPHCFKNVNSVAHNTHSQEKSIGLTGHLYCLLKGIGCQNEILHFVGSVCW